MSNEHPTSLRSGQDGAGDGRHTPGPWEVEDGCYAVRATALPLRAETGLGNGVVCVAVQSTADARLIAAAPELLAALQMVCDSGVSLAEPIESAMLSAIAKARP